MSASPCLDDGDLLALADGETASPELSAHLEGCVDCQTRIDRLRGEVSSLRVLRPEESESLEAMRPSYPSFVGRYFIAGVAAEEPGLVALRGVHSLVNQDVIIHIGQTPVPRDASSRPIAAAEFQPMTRFNDPRFARVYEFDLFGDRPFLATEAVRGRSLGAWIKESSTPTQAAALMADLARGLEAAHRAGLVHGRVASRNLVIDAQGRPRLSGFGLDRLAGLGRETTLQDDIAGLGEILREIVAANPTWGEESHSMHVSIGKIKKRKYEKLKELIDDFERVAHPVHSHAGLVLAALAVMACAGVVLWWMARRTP